MTALPDVTLVSITSVNVDAAYHAMLHCMEGLTFGAAKLICNEAPERLDTRIAWTKTAPMTKNEYSAFVLKELHRHIETSHTLIVQPDGYVLNPERWNPDWLAYDYIGAPWGMVVKAGAYQIPLKKNRVGNGGFSLRSKRLLELTSPINLSTLVFPTRGEDLITCHVLYDYLTERGIRFAPLEVAAAFSIENERHTFGQTLETAFGFHGQFFMARLPDAQRF